MVSDMIFLSTPHRLTSVEPRWGNRQPRRQRRPSWPKPASRRRSPSVQGSLDSTKFSDATSNDDQSVLTGVVQDGDIVDFIVLLLLDGRRKGTDGGNQGHESGSRESHFGEVAGWFSWCGVL